MKEGLKRLLMGTILLVVTVSMWINILEQWGTLLEARKKIADIKGNNAMTEEEVRRLTKKVEDSTRSAYLAQQARDKLGLGEENDYWLKLPEEDRDLDLYPRAKEEVKKEIWRQWLDLFTKGD